MDVELAAGASSAIDRAAEDVREAVRALTGGQGVAVVFHPIGAETYEISLQLLGAARLPHQLWGVVRPCAGHRPPPTVSGLGVRDQVQRLAVGQRTAEFAGLISAALALARTRPAVISDVAGRFPLKQVADAYRTLECGPAGKVLVIPGRDLGE